MDKGKPFQGSLEKRDGHQYAEHTDFRGIL
jgi:hypothetical protein